MTASRQLLSDAFNVHGRIVTALIFLLGFAMPLFPAVIPAIIVLLTIAILFQHRPVVFHGTDRRFMRSALPWIFILYMIHVIGMAWTSNISFGLFDLEIKLSLALFPIIFLLTPRAARRSGELFQAAFILANTIVVPICLVVAFHATVTDVDIYWSKQFIASYFSLFLHPTYAAMYFCMAVAMLYLGSGIAGIGAWGRRGIALLLIIGILLMASKLAWLALLFLVIHILIARWRDAVIRREALSVLVGFVLALIALLSFSEFAAERIREMKAAIAEKSVDRRTETSSGLRLIAWEAAAEVIKAAPLIGTGTGDVKDELMDHYEEQGYSSAFEQKLNAHSQYLQSWAALGLIGLIALIASLIVPLYFAIRESDHLSTSFLGLLLLNFSVESLIEVQAGVVFMAIVAWCLVMRTERSSHP